MRFASAGAMMPGLRKFLFRFAVLVVKIWLVKALFLRIFPLPVLLNLFAAPLFDFIFGIVNSVCFLFFAGRRGFRLDPCFYAILPLFSTGCLLFLGAAFPFST